MPAPENVQVFVGKTTTRVGGDQNDEERGLGKYHRRPRMSQTRLDIEAGRGSQWRETLLATG